MFVRGILYYVIQCGTSAVYLWTKFALDICSYDSSQQYEKLTLLTWLLEAVQRLGTNSYLLQLVKM